MPPSGEASDEARLNPLTLRFSGALENEFQDHYFETSLRQMRIALVLGLGIYAVFGGLDMIAAPRQLREIWILRYLVGTPAVLTAVALSYARFFRQTSQLVIAGATAIAGLVVVVITLIVPEPVNYVYAPGLLLVMFYGFTFMRLRFWYAMALAAFLTISYNLLTLLASDTPLFALSTQNFFLITCTILGGFAGYSIELFIRRNYAQRRVIELGSAELARKYEELERFNRELRDSKQQIIESSRRAQLIFSALAEALPGTVLEDKYELHEKIGSGAFGTVYRGRHVLLDAPVAVKIFRPMPGRNMEKSLERFRREGISAKRISHPNAVAVLDFGISADAIAFLVMELLHGHTLSDELHEFRKLSPRRAAEIALPICSVLAEAHRNGIMHRDIKPSNIFLHHANGREVVKVVDFGIAKLLDSPTSSEDTQLTATGALIGTPSYMAPERMGTEAYGVESDVYSVGVMMYEMITGELPYSGTGTNYLRAAYLQATAEVPAPRAKEHDVPEDLDTLIVRALATDPAHRPTASEMTEGIARVFDLEAPVALPGALAEEEVSPTAMTIERRNVHEAPTQVEDDLAERDTEEM